MDFIHRNLINGQIESTSITKSRSSSGGSGSGGGGGTTIVSATGTFWGQPYDSQTNPTVKGSLKNVDEILTEKNGYRIFPGEDNVTTEGHKHSVISFKDRLNIDDEDELMRVGYCTEKNGAFISNEKNPSKGTISIKDDGDIRLGEQGANVNITGQLEVPNVVADECHVTDGHFGHLYADVFEITEMVIDKLNSVGGSLILSPAHATLDAIMHLTGNEYLLLFRAELDDLSITNDFLVNDLICCCSYNEGSGSNTFYWSKVLEVGTSSQSSKKYHYVRIDLTNDGEHTAQMIGNPPAIGDVIAVLGNTERTDRQNAILLSCTNNNFLDFTNRMTNPTSGMIMAIQGPYIISFAGINSFSLINKQVNVISRNINKFSGNFYSINEGKYYDSWITSVQDAVELRVMRDDAIAAGLVLDGINSKIVAKSGTFEVHNVNDVKVFEINSNGDIVSTGNAEFSGNVTANRFIVKNIIEESQGNYFCKGSCVLGSFPLGSYVYLPNTSATSTAQYSYEILIHGLFSSRSETPPIFKCQGADVICKKSSLKAGTSMIQTFNTLETPNGVYKMYSLPKSAYTGYPVSGSYWFPDVSEEEEADFYFYNN